VIEGLILRSINVVRVTKGRKGRKRRKNKAISVLVVSEGGGKEGKKKKGGLLAEPSYFSPPGGEKEKRREETTLFLFQLSSSPSFMEGRRGEQNIGNAKASDILSGGKGSKGRKKKCLGLHRHGAEGREKKRGEGARDAA